MKFPKATSRSVKDPVLIFCIVVSYTEFLLYLILIDFNFVPLRQTHEVLRRASAKVSRSLLHSSEKFLKDLVRHDNAGVVVGISLHFPVPGERQECRPETLITRSRCQSYLTGWDGTRVATSAGISLANKRPSVCVT